MRKETKRMVAVLWAIVLMLNLFQGATWNIEAEEGEEDSGSYTATTKEQITDSAENQPSMVQTEVDFITTDKLESTNEAAPLPMPIPKPRPKTEEVTIEITKYWTVSAGWMEEDSNIDKTVTFYIYKNGSDKPIQSLTLHSGQFEMGMDGQYMATASVTEDEDGNLLLQTENGQEVNYHVVEFPEYQDFIQVGWKETVEKGKISYEFENRTRLDTDFPLSEIFVEKIWEGKRATAEFTLYKKGEDGNQDEVMGSMTIAGNGKSSVWNYVEFPDWANSSLDDYYVVEKENPSYSQISKEELMIADTDIPAKLYRFRNSKSETPDKPKPEPQPKPQPGTTTTVEVEKIWKNINYEQSKEITFHLYKNNVRIHRLRPSDKLYQEDGSDYRLKFVFDRDQNGNYLPKEENGKKVEYRVEEEVEPGITQLEKVNLSEETADGFKFRFINKINGLHELPQARIYVDKKWEGEPGTANFVLYKKNDENDNLEKIATMQLTGNSRSCIWKNEQNVEVDSFDNFTDDRWNKQIEYYVEEEVLPGYNNDEKQAGKGVETKDGVDSEYIFSFVNRPNKPQEPKQPDTPKEPNKPNTPKEPDKPDTPKEPNTPKEPDKPNTPKEPNIPKEPDTPKEPNTPKEPDKPDTPKEPDKPDIPQEPDTPKEPNTPKKPDKPNTPKEPDKPDTPKEPNIPKEPDKPNTPKEPDKPDTPKEPNKPDIPQEPDTPKEPNTPKEPDKPNTPKEPDTPQEPDTPNTPKEPSKPYEPKEPDTPKQPDIPKEDIPKQPNNPNTPFEDPKVPEGSANVPNKPQPVPSEEIPEEPTTLGDPTLPQTSGVPFAVFIFSGVALCVSGLKLRRKA